MNHKDKEIIEKETLPTSWETLERVAKRLFESKLFNHLENPTQAIAIVEFGRELGIPPMQALQMMAIVNGKLCVQSQLLLALFRKYGGEIEILESTAERCRIKIKRPEGKEYEEEFTIQEAERLGLTTKKNWKQQPENMLFWRAVAKAIRRYAPDLVLGVYTIEEMSEGEKTTVEDIEAEVETQPKPESEVGPQKINGTATPEQVKEFERIIKFWPKDLHDTERTNFKLNPSYTLEVLLKIIDDYKKMLKEKPDMKIKGSRFEFRYRRILEKAEQLQDKRINPDELPDDIIKSELWEFDTDWLEFLNKEKVKENITIGQLEALNKIIDRKLKKQEAK